MNLNNVIFMPHECLRQQLLSGYYLLYQHQCLPAHLLSYIMLTNRLF